jgi:hypothetical protein
MQAGHADGTARPTTGESPAAATRSDPAARCGNGGSGRAGRRRGDRRHAGPCSGSPGEAPASNCQAPSKIPRARIRRARAPLGFGHSDASTISGGDVRTRLRTVEQSPSGHHAGPGCDAARARIARAWRPARHRRRRKRRRIRDGRPNIARHLRRHERDRELSAGQATPTVAMAREFPTGRLVP